MRTVLISLCSVYPRTNTDECFLTINCLMLALYQCQYLSPLKQVRHSKITLTFAIMEITILKKMICLNKDCNLSKQIVFLWFCFSLYTVTKITSCFNLKKISCLKILILKLQLVFSHSVNFKFSSFLQCKEHHFPQAQDLDFCFVSLLLHCKKKKNSAKIQ